MGLAATGETAGLSKEFNNYYSLFIEIFKNLEKQLQAGDSRELAEYDQKMR